MRRCTACDYERVAEVADLGPQPISNRFLAAADAPEQTFPMLLGQCRACGLVQLIDPVPAVELMPPYDWITYNEPEAHLDALARVVRALPGIGKESVAAGVSFKDDLTLRRLVGLGFGRSWRIDPRLDFGVTHLGAGVEIIQEQLTPEAAGCIAEHYGAADVVVVRHILEHAHDVPRFLEAVGRLMKPEGCAVIEVHDCTRALETLDYCTLWEEHMAYFTSETLATSIECGGLGVERLERYPYPFEDSLVAICRPRGRRAPSPAAEVLAGEEARLAAFVGALPARRDVVRCHLEAAIARGEKIAFFGAGHLTCTFLMLMGIADLVAFVVDDNPNKKGLFMPGSRLRIRPSEALSAERVRLCLMALSPASEEKVIVCNDAFIGKGGAFASVIPSSPRALEILAAAAH